MSPVVKRVADKVFDGFCPFKEFFVVRFVAGDVVFRNAVSPHLTPFVVVASEPDFCKVFEFFVFCNLGRNKVAVVVPKGFIFARFKKLLSGFCFQKEIFVHEFFHI